MNAKSLGILVGILAAVVVGVLAMHLINRGSIEGGSKQAGARVLEGLNPDAVKTITIESDEGATTLELGDNKWSVQSRDGYPAKFTDVRDTIWKIWELEIVDGITAGASKLGRFNLIKPGTEGADKEEVGKVVTLKGEGDKELAQLVIGKDFEGAPKENEPSPFPGFQMGEKGTFVWTPSESETVWRVKEDFMSLRTKPSDWLDKTFIKGNSIKSVSVEHPDGDKWTISREAKGGTLQLADAQEGEEFDATKASASGNVFANPAFQDILVQAEKDKAGLEQGVNATIETFEGFTYKVAIGNEVGGESSSTDRYMTVAVSYTQPAEPDYDAEVAAKFPPSEAPEGESEEDKAKREADDKSKRDTERETLESAYKKEIEDSSKKLETEKAFEGRIYVVTKFTVDGLLKKRAELLKVEEAETTGDESAAPGGASVTTPPVRVPPLDGDFGATAVTPPVRVEIPQPQPPVTPPASIEIPEPEVIPPAPDDADPVPDADADVVPDADATADTPEPASSADAAPAPEENGDDQQ